MTNDPSQEYQEDRVPPDRDLDLCLGYLLGELDQESRLAFEEQLAASPELGDALLEQADLLLNLSSTSTVAPVSTPARSSPASHPAVSPRWRWIAVAASIAACVALATQVSLLAPNEEQVGQTASMETGNSNEQLLIARAWATSHYPIETVEEFADEKIDDAVEIASDDQSSDIDSAVSWMFVAISASPEMQSDGENDG